ncbi:MAG: hypothetical protein E2O88_00320 [Bacteroidetes bacterium]|nr:MAG: hypothetical protein E2O88_00320 [Bacteroidota bacterium]
MKPLLSIQLLLMALSIGIFSCSSSKYAQSGTSEYDDLYFNKGDRYPVMSIEGTTGVIQRPDQANTGGVGAGYNSKTLNPDYGLPQDAQTENGYAEDEYYVENHDDEYMQQAVEDYLRNNSTYAKRYTSPNYSNNFDDIFWRDPLFYQGTIFDPFYRSYYGMYSPFAYRSYYRPYSSFYRPWGSGLSVSIGFGFGFGSYYGRYYDPFYYGSGFGYGYGYGYGSPYGRYYGSAWCPPSYYGAYNTTVVINNIENSNPGNVRYGTRTSRGSSYIVDNGIRERNTTDATYNSSRIRSRADNTVTQVSERTLNNSGIIQRDQSGTNLRTRDLNQYDQVQYDQVDRSKTRFRTHSLDSRNSGLNINERTGSNSSLQQRSRTINRDTYRTPDRKLGTRRTTDRNRSYSSSLSRNSGSSSYGKTPNRSPASSGVRSRSNYSRRSSSPSKVGSSNYGRRSSSGRVSTPSRSSSPSRIRSSSPSPSRSSSLPSRSSGKSIRSITR